jgi:hypothetical protein
MKGVPTRQFPRRTEAGQAWCEVKPVPNGAVSSYSQYPSNVASSTKAQVAIAGSQPCRENVVQCFAKMAAFKAAMLVSSAIHTLNLD